MIIVKTIITKSSRLDVVAVLDPPLRKLLIHGVSCKKHCFQINNVITTSLTDILENLHDTQIETVDIREPDEIVIEQNNEVIPNLPGYHKINDLPLFS